MKAESSVAFVVDASTTLAWLFPDESHPAAAEAWRRSDRETVIVPPVWWFEIRNALLVGERRGRTTQEQTARFLDDLSQLEIEIAAQPLDSGVFTLARRHQLTFYDAAYLELARRERIALATLDRRLVTAARTERVPVVAES